MERRYEKDGQKGVEYYFAWCRKKHIHVKPIKSGREAWFKLKEFHVQSSLSARIRILKRLFRVTLKDNESMEDHLQFVFEKLSELDEIGYGLDNGMAIGVVLASLNSDYDPLITALEAWDESRLKLNAVRSKLIEEWRRKKNVTEAETSENALKVFDRLGKDNRDRVICRRCNRRGHVEKYCRTRMETSNDKPQENANYARVAFTAQFKTSRYSPPKFKTANWKKNKRVCYVCGDKKHTIAMCPKKTKNEK